MYPTTFDLDRDTETPPPPPTAPKNRRGMTAAALVLAGALVGGGVGGAVGAALSDGTTTVTTGSGAPIVAAPAADPKSYTAIAAQVLPSVVSIRVTGGGSSGTGSGIIIRSDGHILTNNHVVDAAVGGGGTVTVTFNDGSTASAKIVGTDAAYDLAVIKVNKSGLKPATLGSSASLRVGDPVIAIGSPLGLSGTVTTGIVSALNRPVNTTNQQQSPFGGSAPTESTVISAIQTDAAINPGNSGGALVDGAGQVVGINSAIASLGTSGNIGVGFAIPIDQARDIATQLIATGKAAHPILGVSIADVTTSAGAGQVLVQAVTSGGPAQKAGIQNGDVIVEIAGTKITDTDALIATVRAHKPGEKVSVTYERSGTRHTVSVQLADATTSPS
ncbi:MAG: putative serine protease PepD [Frankiales bacterium]|jgi:putative serine protease PepD|nr:putative serine protease PepD [Frankiales bacterium]